MSNSYSPYPPLGQGKAKIIKQVIALFIACGLIWFSFKGANCAVVFKYASSANLFWLGLMCVSALCSHFLRAWRWVILLRPVAKRNIRIWHSFCAVLYGYAINIVIPRGGEVIRLISICKMESLPWAGVLPTLLIDRLLDLVILALFLGFTLVVLPAAQLTSLPWLYPCGISLTVGTIILFLALPKLASGANFLLSLPWLKRLIQPSLMTKIQNLLEQFDQGAQSLSNPMSYPLIIISSLGIWFCYWLNFYFVLSAFGLDKVLTLNQALIVFSVGSVGALVPTPGCVGGFHLLVSKCLMLVAAVDQNLALAFATVLHAFAFVIITSFAAFICFLWQNLRQSKY